MFTTIHTTSPRTAKTITAALVSVALLLGACGEAERPQVATAGPETTAASTTSTGQESAAPEGVPEAPLRAISEVDRLPAFFGPGDDIVMHTFDETTDFGSATVMLVERVTDDWIEVHLPSRPNGQTGWVRASDVRLEQLDTAVHVDLERRELTVWNDGNLITRTSVAVGSSENPTPVGTFYVTDKLETPDDEGAYGPYAIGLSAFSDTLTEFAGGEGQIGLHGTNDPSSIGQAISHGCVRLPNHLITQLASELPLGTPVVIS